MMTILEASFAHLPTWSSPATLGSDEKLKPVHIYRRSLCGGLVPTVNSRFVWRYPENLPGRGSFRGHRVAIPQNTSHRLTKEGVI